MSEPSFVPLLAALNEHGVEYFVVGHQLLRTRLGDLDVRGTIMEASGYDDLIETMRRCRRFERC